MEFKKCQIANVVYGDATDQDIKNQIPENEGMRTSSVSIIEDALKTFYQGQTADRNKKSSAANLTGEALYNMFRLLAVCHTVVVEKD